MYQEYLSRGNSIYSPKIHDEESKFILEVPVPGFDKESLNLSIEEDVLFLNGKNDSTHIEKAFRLGDEVDYEKITAEVKNGIIKIDLPKVEILKKEISIN